MSKITQALLSLSLDGVVCSTFEILYYLFIIYLYLSSLF